jgi:hypothetical protein
MGAQFIGIYTTLLLLIEYRKQCAQFCVGGSGQQVIADLEISDFTISDFEISGF